MRPGDHIIAGKHSSELFCDAAIDFLQKYNSTDPFFMYVSFFAPHDPRTMPEKYQKMYDPEKISLPANFAEEHPFDNGSLKIRDELLAGFPRTPNEVREHIADYYAMITHLDAEMGRVLEALEQTGKADNTIIVFSGDNGLAVGQHGLFGKQNCYEHSIRVPLIFTGPDIPQNNRTESFAYLFDIFPTLCDLVDIEKPSSVEGKSLVPAIQRDEEIRDTIFAAYMGYQRCVKKQKVQTDRIQCEWPA